MQQLKKNPFDMSAFKTQWIQNNLNSIQTFQLTVLQKTKSQFKIKSKDEKANLYQFKPFFRLLCLTFELRKSKRMNQT